MSAVSIAEGIRNDINLYRGTIRIMEGQLGALVNASRTAKVTGSDFTFVQLAPALEALNIEILSNFAAWKSALAVRREKMLIALQGVREASDMEGKTSETKFFLDAMEAIKESYLRDINLWKGVITDYGTSLQKTTQAEDQRQARLAVEEELRRVRAIVDATNKIIDAPDNIFTATIQSIAEFAGRNPLVTAGIALAIWWFFSSGAAGELWSTGKEVGKAAVSK
jgi:hypothetical protein